MACIKIKIAHTEPHDVINIVKKVTKSDLSGKQFYKWYSVNDSVGNTYDYMRKSDAIKHAKKALKRLNERLGSNWRLVID